MLAITGASGNTGRVIVEKLLDQGETVRVIGRDGGRLARFVQKGAEAFVAEVTDAAALDGGGSTALYIRGKSVARPARRLTNLLVAYDSSARYEQFRDLIAPMTPRIAALP